MTEVIKDWDKLPKAHSDSGDFVIIAEKDEGGGYDEYKECLGVDSSMLLIWSFLSGCSCSGTNEQETLHSDTAKIFRIESNKSAEEFYDSYKVEPYEANYRNY